MGTRQNGEESKSTRTTKKRPTRTSRRRKSAFGGELPERRQPRRTRVGSVFTQVEDVLKESFIGFQYTTNAERQDALQCLYDAEESMSSDKGDAWAFPAPLHLPTTPSGVLLPPQPDLSGN